MDDADALKAQKEQCIFCKIIAGEIPSRTVYSDDHMVALLDIRPASRGHVLVMPREHYPILPTIPLPLMQHLFEKASILSRSIKEAMLCNHVDVFVANGAVAGQQSPHFLFHLIPREEVIFFDLPAKASKEENGASLEACLPRINQLMDSYLTQMGRKVTVVQPANLDRLIEVINANADLKEAVMDRPEEVKEAIRTQEKWQQLFAGVDVDKLSQNLNELARRKA